MKTILMIFMFLVEALFCFGQKKPLTVDQTFFLLGITDECRGWQKIGSADSVIDRYYPDESVLVGVIDTLLCRKYPDLKCLVETSGARTLYCKRLVDKMNKYYVLKRRDALQVNSDWTMTPVFDGKLKEGIFESDEQKCSFIAGVFMRYGYRDNGTFIIRLANSGEKVEICHSLLEELGCTALKLERKQTILQDNRLIFTPAEELSEYLLRTTALKTYLQHIEAKKQPVL